MLKSAAPIKTEIAVSKPLTWVMRPKKEVPQMEQTMPIKILAPKIKVLERPKDKKLPKVPEKPEVPKREKRTKTPSPTRARNDRNAANPRPGLV